MILQPDGKVLVAATLSPFITDSSMLVRYMPDGSLDSSFGTNGVVINKIQYSSTPARVKLQQDGKIIIAGGTGGGIETYAHFLVSRFNSDGSIYSSFSDSGYQITEISQSDASRGLVIQQNGKIVLTGSIINYDITPEVYSIALTRYNNDDITKQQQIISKIRHWIQHHNGIVWDNAKSVNSYAVQRSGDGIHWSTVHNQQSIANSQPLTVNSYYNDPAPLSGTNYYRVQTTSVDGAVNYSNVLAVTPDDALNIVISPNPAKSSLTIQGLPLNQNIRLSVVDFSGNTTISQQLPANGNNSYNLTISSLKAGNYLLKIEMKNEVITKKFVKE